MDLEGRVLEVVNFFVYVLTCFVHLRSEWVQQLKDILTAQYGKPKKTPRGSPSSTEDIVADDAEVAAESGLGAAPETEVAAEASAAVGPKPIPTGSVVDTMETLPLPHQDRPVCP